MIIDSKSLNQALFFKFMDIDFRLHKPYKSYPYNHDFTFKPIFYFNSKGRKENLPVPQGISSYPLYDESINHIGMYVQQNPFFSFDKATKLKLSDSNLPDKLLSYSPVDTIRFDTSKDFANDTPKFIDNFISHLRNLSGQFWIGKPRLDNEGVSTEGMIKRSGAIERFKHHSNLLTIIRYNKGIPINLEIWKNAIDNLTNNIDVDFARTLYLDAIYQYAKNQNREVVLNVANSLDITINKFFKLLHEKISTKDVFYRDEFVKKYRLNKKVSSTFLPGLVSEFLEGIIGLNYKNEKPEHYEVIRVFWIENRNIVAHGGHVKIENEEAFALFEATENLTEWIDDINIEKISLKIIV
ncbi:hypothetical protein CQA01_43890 [Cyclobacterium qasimii]|nr:hypothetical protein CQA01_43890 [Cyclobacterium qasimii]